MQLQSIIKKLLLASLLCISSFLTSAQELTKDAIVGKWLIVKIGDLDTKDLGIGVDIWEFTLNEWIVTTGHKTLPPEAYKLAANEITLGNDAHLYTIKVIEFTENNMVVDSNGIIQTLQRMETSL